MKHAGRGWGGAIGRLAFLLAVAAMVPACGGGSSSGGGGAGGAGAGLGGSPGGPGAATSAWQNPLPAGHRLNDVVAYDPDNGTDDDEVIWAVGDQGVIRFSDDGGATWSDLDSGVTENLHGIALLSSASAGTEVLVVVGENGTILLSDDGGATWVDPTTVPAAVTGLDFYGVTFTSSSQGWLVGQSDEANSNARTVLVTTDGGDTWSAQSAGNASFTGQRLFDVSMATATLGWAVGEYASPTSGEILRTADGLNWGQVNTWNVFHGVDSFDAGAGAELAIVVGSFGVIFRTATGGTPTYYTQLYSSTLNDYPTLYGVDFISATVGWAVGDNGVIFKSTDGGLNWTEQSADSQGALQSVVATDANLVWAVGDGMRTLGTRDGGATDWVDLLSSTAVTRESLNGVNFVSSTNGWTVGANGTILATTNGGTVWAPQTSTTTRSLNAVKFVDGSDGWAVGANGAIVATVDGGTTWGPQTSGVNRALNGVDFVSGTQGWIVGNNGTILRTDDGLSWGEQTSATTKKHLNAVDFVDAMTGWAVGQNSVIIKTVDGGVTWTSQTSPSNQQLFGLAMNGTQIGYAVGNAGVILKTTNGGTTWVEQTSGVDVALRSVSFNDDFHGVAAGDGGTILATVDGGATWTPVAGTANDLAGVDMVSNTDGWVVGSVGTIIKLD